MPPKKDGISLVYLQVRKMKVGFTNHKGTETHNIASSIVYRINRRIILHAIGTRRQMFTNVFQCHECIVTGFMCIRGNVADGVAVCNSDGFYSDGLSVGSRNHVTFLLSCNVHLWINVPFLCFIIIQSTLML